MKSNKELESIALQLRIDVLEMLLNAGSGHLSGAFSATDIFTYLYFQQLKHNPQDPLWNDRDYFLVSNGHICMVWYAALARSGYFSVEELKNIRKLGSILQGHPWNIKTPGIFNSSGPLGNGGGQAIGVAIGLKIDKRPNHVYCFLSDGEHGEGSTWEAIMSAPKFKLDNLTFIVDRNGIQIDGKVSDIMPLDIISTENDEFVDKYKAFGWNVVTINGHDFNSIRNVFEQENIKDIPTVIIADTVAGKGLPEIEGSPSYHDWRGDNELAIRSIELLKSKLNSISDKQPYNE